MCLRDAQALPHREHCRKNSLQSCIAKSFITCDLFLPNIVFVPEEKKKKKENKTTETGEKGSC